MRTNWWRVIFGAAVLVVMLWVTLDGLPGCRHERPARYLNAPAG